MRRPRSPIRTAPAAVPVVLPQSQQPPPQLPHAQQPAALAGDADAVMARRRREELLAFYREHDPTKIAVVDELLENSFIELCDALVEKYGMEQLPFSELKESGWVSRYVPSPRQPSELGAGEYESVRQRRREELLAFYREHDPAKMAVVDKLLANSFGDLCDALVEKYGATPFSEVVS